MKNRLVLRHLATMILAFVMLFILIPRADAEFETPAGSAILIEASTGKVIFEKDADTPMPPASITKIMTLLLGFEAVEQGDASWDELITVSEKAWQMEGSTMFLEVDTTVPYSEVINGISVVSANDGCVALAEHLYGSESAFVEVMNQRARDLGLSNTQFKNSSGLPEEGHYMSARDIATLAQYLIENHPQVLEIESQTEFTYADITQPNRNPLLGTFPGADGLKTGWTTEAGYCLVGTAYQDGMRMISVVLNTSDVDERLAASKDLLAHGFTSHKRITVFSTGDTVDEVQVKNGEQDTVSATVKENLVIVVPVDQEDNYEVDILPDSQALTAPIDQDTVVGEVQIKLDGNLLADAELLSSEDVPKAGIFSIIIKSIADFFKSLFNIGIE